MKKNKLLLPLLTLLLLPSCNGANKEEKQELIIFNVEDYISIEDEGCRDLIAEFEEEFNCEVKYYTYDTNETMYNQYKLQTEGTYDLVMASEYMIQKMAKEGLIEKYDSFAENIPNYEQYCSEPLRQKLKNMVITEKDGTTSTIDEYAVGYMWGTLGIVYNADYVDDSEGILSWDALYAEEYDNYASIKNSMRDAYDVGLIHGFSHNDEQYQELLEKYYADDASEEDIAAFTTYLQQVFDFKEFHRDIVGDPTNDANYQYNVNKIELVKNELIELKKNIFGFETDSGKQDIVEGSKIKMNLAYSGDAVYSIQCAMDLPEPKNLKYTVPYEGGNIWYDGWMLAKNAPHKDLAYQFLNFISDPENAAANMEYIGYTPFINGDGMFDMVATTYGATDYYEDGVYYGEYEEDEYYGDIVIYNDKLYHCIQDTEEAEETILPTNTEYFECLDLSIITLDDLDDCEMYSSNGHFYYHYLEEDDEEVEPYDLSYIYTTDTQDLESGRRPIVYPFEGLDNLLETQYPDAFTIARCAVMNDYGDCNEEVIIMWGQIKAYTNMTPYYVILIVFVVLVIALAVFLIINKKLSARYKRKSEK